MHFATMLTGCAVFSIYVLSANSPVFPHVPQHLCLDPMPMQLCFVIRFLPTIFLVGARYLSDAQLLVCSEEKQLCSLCEKKVVVR